MWVKICGITRLEDARLAEELGADAIGFVFAPSPRQIDPFSAATISRQLGKVTKVGVFVDQELGQVQEIRELCRLDIVQLHGQESPRYCCNLGSTVIKAFRIRDAAALEQILDYQQVWRILLDSFHPQKQGGTGQPIESDLLRGYAGFERTILAGGINPENVEKVSTSFRPFGIDVSSSVEKAPGIKDANKMDQLLQNLRKG
jgi:phosphoribosylanthranilate isomerase